MQRRWGLGLLAVLLGFFVGMSCWAGGEDKNLQAPTTQGLMDKMLAQLMALKKFLIPESAFLAPQNTDEISDRLKEFAELAQQTQHDPVLGQNNFKFSRQVLQDQLNDVERLFRLGNKPYARWKLASTMTVCMSCHTQLPSVSRSFGEFTNEKVFASAFDQAEFLFVARVFDKSFELFDSVVEGYPKNELTATQVQTALERQLAYLSRVKRDPKLGLATMKKHLKNTKLPPFVTKNLKAWILQFEGWNSQKMPDPATASEQMVLNFARKNVGTSGKIMEAGHPNLVNYLRVSGVLFEYLQRNPRSKATAEVLYWLAVCDRSINNTFFFSLADLYLKECMTQHPTDPFAKKCYKEYEDETIFGYTGSSGTHMPKEIQDELDHLKEVVGLKKKKTQ